MNIERIESNGTLYAIVFRHELVVGDGVKFLTPADYPLQVALIERKAGYSFRPHIHNDFRYEVNTTQEFLYVEHGRIRARIFDHEWNTVAETELKGETSCFLFVEDIPSTFSKTHGWSK